MTLPGIAGNKRLRTRECSGSGCFGQIPKEEAAGDTTTTWAEALHQGKAAISSYADKYRVDHAQSCRYRDLPPSVHNAAAAGGRNPRPRLEKALADLNEARRRD
ncbi:hypothetical protein [Streptomyces sp. NPDC001070]